MFYKNTIKTQEVKNITIKFDEFNKNPIPQNEIHSNAGKSPKIAYNFKLEDGKIEDGYGFKDLTIPYSEDDKTEHYVDPKSEDIIAVWDFRWFSKDLNNANTFIFFMGSDYIPKYFYEYKWQDLISEINVNFTSKPDVFEYRFKVGNRLIMSSPTDNIVVSAGADGTFFYENTPHISSSCVHENCFYGIASNDDSTLLYSSDIAYDDWDKSRFNELVFSGGEGGRLRKVFSFNDYVYLFRENGIVKIYPFSSNNPLSITHIYYSTALIIPQSIQRCGETMLFLSREGFHTFNGSVVKKLNLDIVKLIDTEHYEKFTSACYKGKYFLACRINFQDDEKIGCENSELGYENNAVLVYDVEQEKVELIRGVDICDFVPVESNIMSKLVCCFHNEYKTHLGELTYDGKIFGETTIKKWTSVTSDFGEGDKTKIIKSISLYALKDCEIEIKSDNEAKVYKIKGKDKLQKLKTNIKGKTFQISFISKIGGQKISNVEINADVLL